MTIEQITLEAFDLFDDLINNKFSADKFNALCAELKKANLTWEQVGDFIRAEELAMTNELMATA